jgi:broad specificity phosphatase PhoE
VLFIVRHGETEWSLNGRHTSRTDLPLTQKGRERATALQSQLAGREFTLVFSSPLRRARETCELAGFGDRAVLTDDLKEFDYGEYEGLTTPQIHEQNPDWNLWRDGCPGGELPDQVGARADRVIERMLGAPGDAIAFAHGHILRVLTARWIVLPAAGGAHFALAAGGIGELGFERETHVVSAWNLF